MKRNKRFNLKYHFKLYIAPFVDHLSVLQVKAFPVMNLFFSDEDIIQIQIHF